MSYQKPFTWSYSALTTYELCPKKYYHLYVAKDVKDEDSSFSADGKIIHDAMKKRVVDGVPLPINLRQHEKLAAKFASAAGEKHGEMKLAITRQFEPCDYFAKDVWCRVVIDLTIVKGNQAIVVDWKTGKRKDDQTQMMLNTAVLAQFVPEIKLFTAVLVWMQSGELTPPFTYTRASFPEAWNQLLPRVAKIEEARKTTTFPANPNGLCAYCPVRSCPHYVERSNQ